MGRAISAAKRKLEQQNDDIFCLESDMERLREERVRMLQGAEVQNRQLDEMWERCTQMERERERLTEALEASEGARLNFEEMWARQD